MPGLLPHRDTARTPPGGHKEAPPGRGTVERSRMEWPGAVVVGTSRHQDCEAGQGSQFTLQQGSPWTSEGMAGHVRVSSMGCRKQGSETTHPLEGTKQGGKKVNTC